MKQKHYLAHHRHRRKQHVQQYRPHQQAVTPHQPNAIFFQGNLSQAMRFGAKGHELSGYVKRKLVLIDRNGNKQIATEKQFFNSGRQIGRIHIDDDEGEF